MIKYPKQTIKSELDFYGKSDTFYANSNGEIQKGRIIAPKKKQLLITSLLGLSEKPKDDLKLTYYSPSKGYDGDPVIFSSGFLTEGRISRDWLQLISEDLFPNRPILLIDWSSSSMTDLIKSLGSIIAQKNVPLLSKKVTDNNPWVKSREHAEIVGKITAELLSNGKIGTRNPNAKFTLVGHSLGGRVMANVIKNMDSDSKIKDVVIMGGAIDSSESLWQNANNKLSGNIYNFYSKNDKVLKFLYRLGNLSTEKAAGLGPIIGDRITNIDMSDYVDCHSAYSESQQARQEMAKEIGKKAST